MALQCDGFKIGRLIDKVKNLKLITSYHLKAPKV